MATVTTHVDPSVSYARRPRALAAVMLAALSLCASAGAAEHAVVDSPASSGQKVEFNVYLPLKDRAKLVALLRDLHRPDSTLFRHWLRPFEFHQAFGRTPAELGHIAAEMESHGLSVSGINEHGMHVSGTVAAVNAALGARLANAHFRSGRQVLVSTAPLHLTPELEAAGAVIPGFSGHMRMSSLARRADGPQSLDQQAGSVGLWFDDLKQAYGFPSYLALSGKGVRIGVLMTPGYNPADMDLYFSHGNLATPKIETVNVHGGAPYDPQTAGETHIDIQHAGGMAPDATIVLYSLPDLYDDSILAGLARIVESNSVDVVNMSFSAPEAFYGPAYNGGTDFSALLGIYDDLFMEGNALGITFVAASGDSGAFAAPAPECFEKAAPSPCGPMLLGIGTPAASPHVTAVGGTNLRTTSGAASLDAAYVRENADYDALASDIFYGTSATGAVWGSGGGISRYFPRPAYQELVSPEYLPAEARQWRTIPDVAFEMGGCPQGTLYEAQTGVCPPDRSYDWVALDGQLSGVIGTSLSAPDFAGLTALKIQAQHSRLGNLNYEIYALAAAQEQGYGRVVYHRNISGSNGFHRTAPAYNLVTGNGSVIGAEFVLARPLPRAGRPQTPSNP